MTSPFIVRYRDELVTCVGFVDDRAVVVFSNRTLHLLPLNELRVAYKASDWPIGFTEFVDEPEQDG